MTRRIFISYTTGDEANVNELYDSLSKLENIEVYIPEWIPKKDDNFNLKVREGLDTSKALIVLMTFNSTNTIWLNQEIGYAAAKNIPIIPIIEQGIDIQGFLEGRDYLMFKRGDFRYNIDQVITRLRSILC